MRRLVVVGATAVVLLAGGCGATGSGSSASGAAPGSPHVRPHAGRDHPHHKHKWRLNRRRRAARPHTAGLAYSRASSLVIQAQPAPGTCHAIGSGLLSRPDPGCTPGALNPSVTQATIGQTICVSGWTSTVRPPESVTEAEKGASLAAYGDSGSLSDYEYDHFVPLELGGATNAPRNLWPEPGGSPNAKDGVELALHDRVCSGQMTLAAAQRAITGNWVKLARDLGLGVGAGWRSGSRASAKATCSLRAVYDPSYGDYNVYLDSNQPDAPVTVSDGLGHSHSWHTNPSGYADVYFNAGGRRPGQRVTARVGNAGCAGSL